MKIHLIPDQSLDNDLYTRVLSLLQAVPGVNTFHPTANGLLMLPEDMLEEQKIPDKETFEKQVFTYNNIHKAQDVSISDIRRIWSFPHTRTVLSWTELFKQVQSFRENYRIPENEFAILLTPTANKKNCSPYSMKTIRSTGSSIQMNGNISSPVTRPSPSPLK